MSRLLERIADALRCAFTGHDWHFNRYAKDWCCNRCRTRRANVGVRR